jgi:hypothetical protein
MKVKIVHEKTRLRGHTFRSIEGMRDPRKAHQEKQAIPIPAWQDPKVPARSATVKPTQSIMAKLLKIAKTKDVPPGQAAAFTIEGQKIALFNVEGTYHAIGNTYTRRGGPLSPLRNRFVDRNGGELHHLIRARNEVSAEARPKQFDVPNVVTIGDDDFRDRLNHVEARLVVFSRCRWINERRASIERDRVTVQVPRPVGVSRTPREDAGKNFAHGVENVIADYAVRRVIFRSLHIYFNGHSPPLIEATAVRSETAG